MLSKYFYAKSQREEFKNNLNTLINDLKGQKVILYGAGEGFFELDKKYNIKGNFDIIAIADKKFETDKSNITGLKQVSPEEITNLEFDKILITNERTIKIFYYLTQKLKIQEDKISRIFIEEFKDESLNYLYLCEHKFDKTLPKLVKKLKNKTVILYGAGAFLQTIKKYFDISGLNIIGISDRKYEEHDEDITFEGMKVYSIDEAEELKPDYIVVATKFYTGIIEDLYYNRFRGTGIKIKPLVHKGFLTLLKEIW